MEDFIKNMPKIELHCHLNGSLSNSTLKKLIKLKRTKVNDFDVGDVKIYNTFDSEDSLEACFGKFKLAHDLVDSQESVKMATLNVIDEFSKENVIYVELRSTPRATTEMTKEEYLQAIVDQIIECKKTHPCIIVKYLPSINISYGVAEAEENYKLFLELRRKYPDIVCGIDLSGDASKGKFSEIKEVFQAARAEGFRFGIHCAEYNNEDEIYEKLNFMTSEDRIGHGTFIDDKNPKIWNLFTAKKIPVEICLTSNVLCRSVPSYEDHHISRFIGKHPIVICTDDYGVFQTSLTREFQICVDVYGMDKLQLIELTENANKFSFANESEKQLIADIINEFKKIVETS